MGRLLFLLFTVIPILEVWLLMKVGAYLGFGGTLALVVLTGALGAALAKGEGRRALAAWQRDLREGRAPKDGVLDGVLLLVGGVLLVTPGVLTDATGLLLLIPFTRRLLSGAIRARLERAVKNGRVQVSMGGDMPFGGPFASGPFANNPFTNGPSPFGSRAVVVDVDGEELEPAQLSDEG